MQSILALHAVHLNIDTDTKDTAAESEAPLPNL